MTETARMDTASRLASEEGAAFKMGKVRLRSRQLKQRVFLISCVSLFVLSLCFLSEAGEYREKRILDLLSQTETLEDLEDKVHSNRLFLEAVGLILLEAEEKNMGEDELMNYYLELLKKANWKKWTPYLRTIKW